MRYIKKEEEEWYSERDVKVEDLGYKIFWKKGGGVPQGGFWGWGEGYGEGKERIGSTIKRSVKQSMLQESPHVVLPNLD